MKRASEELKQMGEALVTLRADLMARLSLPVTLAGAIAEAKRLTSFGAIRRQSQYIGKLMRKLDEATLDEVRAALDVARGQSAKETALLHRAEQWRDSLIADDARLERWISEYPDTDAQQLRALIRQARKDRRDAEPEGPVRQGRAYRQIFALVRTALMAGPRPAPDQ
jgi:ribosome-associated protein